MVCSTPDTQEPKLSEHEQQLQELEQAYSSVFYPPAKQSDIMRDAKRNVDFRTLSDEKPDLISAQVRDYLEDLMVYATLRGDLEFLEGKVGMCGYSEIVASRARYESIQTK